MIKKRILFIFVLCLFLFVSVVNAETLTGGVGGSGSSQQTGSGKYTDPTTNTMLSLKVINIEMTGGLNTIIQFSNSTVPASMVSYTNASLVSNTTPVTFKIGSTVIGNGIMGYQRVFAGSPPVEQYGGYVWVSMYSWNTTGYTGNQLVSIVGSSYLDGISQTGGEHSLYIPLTPVTTGYAVFGDSLHFGSGDFIVSRSDSSSATYSVTKPSGLGIEGTVTKTGTSQVTIYDGVTKQAVATQYTQSLTPFSFNVPSQSVIVSIFTPFSNRYNSSILFAPAITPTPTPTPYGTGTYNATFTVKRSNDSIVIPQAFVEIEDLSTQSVFSGYTDSNGQITISYGYAGVQNEFRAWKTGYQYVNWIYTPTGGSTFEKTIYMYPEIGDNPSTPATVNINIYVKSQNGNQPISGAYVALKDDIYGTARHAQLTNASGTAYFPNFPVSAFIDLEISKTGYVPLTEYFGFTPSSDFGMTKYLSTTGGVTPTPTPTPVTYDTLGLTASPNTINLGQTVTLTGTSSNATRLTYNGGLRRTVFMVNKHAQAYPFDFQEIGMFENVNATYWKFRHSYADTWDAPSTASPLTITHVPDTNGIYTYAFIGYETIAGGSGAIATAGTADVTVNGGSGAGSLTMNLFAYDGSTTSHLSNYQMNITDDNSGVVSELGNISYDINRNLPRGNSYTLRASKENYEYGTKQFIVPISPDITEGDFGAMVGVPLFPTGTISAGNTTVTVHVTDIETYYPIGNVQIQMSVDGSSKYTGSDGESASWILPQNTPYTVKAIKSGYCSVTESKNTGTNDYQYVPLFMKYGTCTGQTPTPTPTPTPSVTVTPIWNGTPQEGAIVCGNLPEDATMVDVLKNSLACNGLKDQASQNLGIACLIILFCAIVLGRIAKGIGVLSGVVAGTVLAVVAGFLPFWIIIVVVIMAGLLFAAKVFWTPGG